MNVMSKITKTSLDIDDWFSALEKNIDVWITDPPYPFNNQNGTSRFNHIDNVDEMYTRLDWAGIESFIKNAFERSNDGARLYIFCNRDGLRRTWGALEAAGWKFRNMLVWNKSVMGMGYHWRNQTEYILYASKGKPKNYVQGVPNIFEYKKPKGQSAKPPEIWRDILNRTLCEGDVCADPFAGTDPLSIALEDQGLYATLGESYSNILDTIKS